MDFEVFVLFAIACGAVGIAVLGRGRRRTELLAAASPGEPDDRKFARVARTHDLTRPIDLAHTTSFASGAAADAMTARLRRIGFHAETRPPADGRGPATDRHIWQSYAWKNQVVTLDVVRRTRGDLAGIAKSFDGTYDGWEVGPAVPQNR